MSGFCYVIFPSNLVHFVELFGHRNTVVKLKFTDTWHASHKIKRNFSLPLIHGVNPLNMELSLSAREDIDMEVGGLMVSVKTNPRSRNYVIFF